MKLADLKKLHSQYPDLTVQIVSNSYSQYHIRVKVGNDYKTLRGWFGSPIHFNCIQSAQEYLQNNTAIRYVYLVQSLPQDEVDPRKANDHDMYRDEEPGIKVDLYHQ